MKKCINLKVVGQDSELESFLNLCSMIQKCGDRGSGRKISVVVDGDGSGRLSFFLNGEEDRIPTTDGDVEEKLEVWIGE